MENPATRFIAKLCSPTKLANQKMEPSTKPADTTPTKKRGRGMMLGIAAIVVIVIIAVSAYFFYGMPQAPAATVNIQDSANCTPPGLAACQFNSNSVSIATGKSVKWQNTGSQTHSVTFFTNNSTATPPSGQASIDPNTSYTATFGTAGTFYYYCTYHSWMKGTVTVS